jgi:hypothetical protein
MLDFISNIFKPAVSLVDELHVSDEERLKLRNELASIQASMQAKSVELMAAEAKSDHWIVASWRPICAICLFSLIMADGYGIAKAPTQVYDLAQIFLSVYGTSRGVEKVARIIRK